MSQDMQRVRKPGRQWGKTVKVMSASVLSLALLAAAAPVASADEYADRARVLKQIEAQTGSVNAAQSRYQQKVELAQKADAKAQEANQVWEDAQSKLQDAQQVANRRQQELLTAQERVQVAQKELAEANAHLEAERAQMATIGREALQQNSHLESLAALITSSSTADLADRLMWHDAMARESDRRFAQFKVVQEQKIAAEKKLQLAQKDAEVAKQASDQAVAYQAVVEQEAQDAALEAASAKAEADEAQAVAAQDLEAEKAKLEVYQQQSAEVEARIKARLAREQAEREKRAKEAAAREAANKAAAQKAAKAAQQGNKSSGGTKTPIQPVYSGGTVAGTFGPPTVNYRVTSRYGMRLHPVLNIWVLHDGIDLAAYCGAPLIAPADGVVAEVGWHSGGLGNRLVLDLDPSYQGQIVSVLYGHAQGYEVSVGQRVKKDRKSVV